MPKSTFFGAGTSLLKSYKNIIFPPYFHLFSTLLRAVKSCWLLLASYSLLLLQALLPRVVWNPRKTTFFDSFCCLQLLPIKQLRKNHLPGGKHRASEGRASSKITPKKCLTCRLKSPRKATFFDSFCCLQLLPIKQLRKNHLPGGKQHGPKGRTDAFRQLLLPAAASNKTASKKSPAGGKTAWP